MSFHDGKKTYAVVAAAIIYAVLGVALGQISVDEAVKIILAALGGAAIRHAIKQASK